MLQEKTKKTKKKQVNSAIDANLILATDKRIIITNNTGFRTKNLIQDMPFDSINSIKLQEGDLSSSIVFNGSGFANVAEMSEASIQRAWGIEEENNSGLCAKNRCKGVCKYSKRTNRKEWC